MDELIKIVGIFVAAISMLTGIFMPIILSMVKKNARNTDDKLSILYTGQEKTFDAISKMRLSLNDTKNRTFINKSDIKKLEGITNEKINTHEKRLNSQSVRGIDNKEKIAVLSTKIGIK